MNDPVATLDVAPFLAAGTVLVLDFDGTLARIVPDRDAARLSIRTRELLRRVAARYPVAVLSGRAASDVARRLEGVPVARVVGSHGAEWDRGDGRARTWRRRVVEWTRRLAPVLASEPGTELEDKGLSLAVHYRGAPHPHDAASLIRAAAMALPGATVIPGKWVVNVIPRESGGKAGAVRRLARELRARRLVFVGDDDTDELAFRADLPVPALMVRVGPAAHSAAHVVLPHRRDVDRLLARLLAAQAGPERRSA